MWVDKCLQLFRDVGELKIGRYDWHELGFTASAMLARTRGKDEPGLWICGLSVLPLSCDGGTVI